MTPTYQIRPATELDADTLAALGVQVFLDTYSTPGVWPQIAREAFELFTPAAFEQAMRDPMQAIWVAADAQPGQDRRLFGFAWLKLNSPVPLSTMSPGVEVNKLYVQAAMKGKGIGAALLNASCDAAAQANLGSIWLTAWDGNTAALGFYERQGMLDVGEVWHDLQGDVFLNRVLVRSVSRVRSVSPIGEPGTS